MKAQNMTQQRRPVVRDHHTQPVTIGDAIAVAMLLATSALLGAALYFQAVWV